MLKYFFVYRMPVVTLLLHFLMALLYDLDSPDPSRNKYLVILEAIVWNIIIQGCLQPIAAIIVGFFICPLISMIILAGKIKVKSEERRALCNNLTLGPLN